MTRAAASRDRAELLVGGGDRRRPITGGPGLSVERVQPLAQLGLGRVDGDDGRGRRGGGGAGERLDVAGERA